MAAQIDIRRDDATSAKFADLGSELFLIRSGDSKIGSLWRAPSYQSLVWQGGIDFSRLQEEALEGLSLLSQREVSIDGSQTDVHLQAKFISPDGPNGPKLLAYRLSPRLPMVGYKRALGEAAKLDFARYDLVLGQRKSKESYAFTAENDGDKIGEIAVSLPPNRAWQDRALDWVLAHNVVTPELTGAISGGELAQAINSRFGLLSD